MFEPCETDCNIGRYEPEKCPIYDKIYRVGTLAGYRLYCLDGLNKVASAEWIEADDDEAAIEVAKTNFAGGECEVWQGARFVARVDCRGNG